MPTPAVHIEDRGYQFADGVYEVCEVARGFIVDMTRHLDRLDRSLTELRDRLADVAGALEIVMREVVRRNRVTNGLVYLQVTRGVARRDHVFPADASRRGRRDRQAHRPGRRREARRERHRRSITVPENRWDRVDIKTVGLLPNVLARQKAKEAGAQEAWFVDADGTVKEGAATNAWIVTRDGMLVTRPADHGILRGITRTTLFDVAAQARPRDRGARLHGRGGQGGARSLHHRGDQLVMPVVAIDGDPVANGHPGSIALSLRDAFFDVAEKTQA